MRVLWVAVVLVALAGVARADELPAVPVPPEHPLQMASFATDERRWSFEVLGTAVGDVTNRHVVMGGATVGLGYYVLDNLAVQLDFTGYGFNEGVVSGGGGGVTLGLRHHLFDVGDNSVFADVSGGVIELSSRVPYHGTRFSDTFEVGLGVAHPIDERTSLLVGVRYFHLSNANRLGDDRNPSVNGIQGVVGVLWRF